MESQYLLRVNGLDYFVATQDEINSYLAETEIDNKDEFEIYNFNVNAFEADVKALSDFYADECDA